MLGQKPIHRQLRSLTVSLAVGALSGAPAGADSTPPVSPSAFHGVIAGEFYVEPPTLENLGFEWRIEGDANRDASVQVAYRKKGERTWKRGLPLLRLQGEEVVSRMFKPAFTYVAPNMFAGSILDLEADTEYEARFTLTDPDGVTGESVKAVAVRTRAEPMPSPDGRVFHVYPFGFKGPRQQPSFTGLLGAYYEGSVGGDWYNAFNPRVRPGDIILVHAGLYKDDRFRYGHELSSQWNECCNTTGDGTYYLTARGTPERPIVIKAAGDGEVIFDGDANYNLFNVEAADYNYFEGLTFRNTEIAFEAGIKRIAGAKGLTFKHSKFYDIGIGIHSDYAGSKDFYIADNEFTGRHDPSLLMGWNAAWSKVPGFAQHSRLLSQFAVKVYGSGHVIAFNRVRNFHDGLDHATYGDPDDYPKTRHEQEPSSFDIYNNDISNMHDNCIEADGGMHNVRVMRNLCMNSGGQGYSLQPLLGGPAYIIRNIMYNSPMAGAIKFHEFPAGGLFYNNTWFSNFAPGPDNAGQNMQLRNNLFLRQIESAPLLQMSTFTNYSSSDYNGFFAGPRVDPFSWNSPPFEIRVDTEHPLVKRSFKTLQDYSRATGQDAHSIMVDYSAFRRVAPTNPAAPVTTLYDAAGFDWRLSAHSAAIDRGVVIPNVTDAFRGSAPDLGAIESGAPPLHFGPRPPHVTAPNRATSGGIGKSPVAEHRPGLRRRARRTLCIRQTTPTFAAISFAPPLSRCPAAG
ncbi:MAG: hypothetical protein M3N97_16785 [Pseudomonadota bacterium]|nr:hypothetical protein [Pseudomonadota bacterium]